MRDFEIHIESNKDREITKCEVCIEGKPVSLEDLTDEELKYFYDDLKNLKRNAYEFSLIMNAKIVQTEE